MAELELVLPLPPTANRYWRMFRGRMLVSREAKAYKREAGWLARAAGAQPITGPVRVSLWVYRAQRRGDLDNFTKVLFDALNGVLWLDDGQVVEEHSYLRLDRENPRVVIVAEPVPGSQGMSR